MKKRYKVNDGLDSWRIDCPCGAIIDANAFRAYVNSLGQLIWSCSFCGQDFRGYKPKDIYLI